VLQIDKYPLTSSPTLLHCGGEGSSVYEENKFNEGSPPSSFAKERGTGGEVGCRASRRAFCIIDKSREMCYNITSE